MALLNAPTLVSGQLQSFFEKIAAGQAPEKFNREFLRDLGFKSSNHLALLPLLKGLGFISADNIPTDRYRAYLDQTRSKRVMAEALKEAFGDIFVIKAKPGKADADIIKGKFKSTYNLSDLSADRAAKTFLALLDLADQDAITGSEKSLTSPPITVPIGTPVEQSSAQNKKIQAFGLNYNIEIHLPATKDVEVYNAIFKSLRAHIID